MKEENLALCLLLSKKGALLSKIKLSTFSLARQTGFSQQSISRKLRELETDGLIERAASTSGIELIFTQKGKNELESFYLELKDIFSKKKSQSLKGKVVDGLGEGSYYTAIPQYKEQFKKLFGFDLFPGTLNLEVDPAQRNIFTSAPPIQIEGFKTAQRTFGGINCWPCKVNSKVSAVAILPHRTNHPANIIELVAPINLRKKLSLENKSVVEVKLQ
ncbi:MAG TPA: DUF120 domain-containing protein [archaeon]|nr:DUF120 domain-containing protein [archaeon]